jgi:hypothetical protein
MVQTVTSASKSLCISPQRKRAKHATAIAPPPQPEILNQFRTKLGNRTQGANILFEVALLFQI